MLSNWEGRYQRGETGWDRGGASPALSRLLEHLPAKARVLVPGCGRGHEVVELARLGFMATAVDIAPSATAHLRKQLLRHELDAKVVTGDLFDFVAKYPFDAVYEQTCLCAMDPTQREVYVDQLYAWLQPGGMLFALFMQTGCAGGPPFHCDLLAMRELFDTARWQWPENEPIFTPHANGRFELGYSLVRRPD